MKEVGRNDPCPCGSGKKFKKCCAQKSPMQRRTFTPLASTSNKNTTSHIAGMVSKTLRDAKPAEDKKLDKEVKKESHSGGVEPKS